MSIIIFRSCEAIYSELLDKAMACQIFGIGDDHNSFMSGVWGKITEFHRRIDITGEQSQKNKLLEISDMLEMRYQNYDHLTKSIIVEFLRNKRNSDNVLTLFDVLQTQQSKIRDTLDEIKGSLDKIGNHNNKSVNKSAKGIEANLVGIAEKSIVTDCTLKTVGEPLCDVHSFTAKQGTKVRRVYEYLKLRNSFVPISEIVSGTELDSDQVRSALTSSKSSLKRIVVKKVDSGRVLYSLYED